MIPPITIPALTCDQPTHDRQQVNALCLRVGCTESPAQCHYCTVELHQKCISFTKKIDEIPKLFQPVQVIISHLETIQTNINKLLKQLITSVNQQVEPISQFYANPNLSNLKLLGTLLKQELEQIVQDLVMITQMEIDEIFNQIPKRSIASEYEPIMLQQVVNQKSQESQYATDYYNKGNSLFAKKDYFQAQKYYESAIKLDQDYKDVWLAKGNELFEMKQYKKALEYYIKAMKSEPNSENIFYVKGNVLFQLHQYHLAKIYYRHAINFNPSDQVFRDNYRMINQFIPHHY